MIAAASHEPMRLESHHSPGGHHVTLVSRIRLRCSHFRGIAVRGVVVSAILATISVVTPFTPSAFAEPEPALAQAITAAHGQCGPLRYDPVVEQAAQMINQSTQTYLDHTADNVPIDEPHPTALAKDFGINGTKVYSLKGAGYSEADAITGLLVEGFNVLPDCAYRDFGVSMLHDDSTGFSLVTAVLVGP
jgi:hypothetical protein